MTHDQAPGVNAPTRCAKAAHDARGQADLRPAFLAPATAIALAAILRAQARPLPHQLGWADQLQAWGETHLDRQDETP